jgi:hypothetical protein
MRTTSAAPLKACVCSRRAPQSPSPTDEADGPTPSRGEREIDQTPAPEAQAGGERPQLRALEVQARELATRAHVQQLQRGRHHCRAAGVKEL